jgi:hypothetical protein
MSDRAVVGRARKLLRRVCAYGRALLRDLYLGAHSAAPRTASASLAVEGIAQADHNRYLAEWHSGSEVARLLEECKARASAASQQISREIARRIPDHRARGLPESFVRFHEKASLSLAYTFEELAFLVTLGCVAIRRGTRHDYFMLTEWKELSRQGAGWLGGMRRHHLDLSAPFPLPGSDVEKTAKSMREALDHVVAVQEVLAVSARDESRHESPRLRSMDLLAAVLGRPPYIYSAKALSMFEGGLDQRLLKQLVDEALSDSPIM